MICVPRDFGHLYLSLKLSDVVVYIIYQYVGPWCFVGFLGIFVCFVFKCCFLEVDVQGTIV